MKFRVTSPYGDRVLNGVRQFHKGIDIVFEENKEVRAFVDGVVVFSLIITDKKNKTWEWGNYVRIDSEDGLRCYYCHLDKRLVKSGDKVKAGDVIGIMGSTGLSTGPHTHFEIRNQDGKSVNPAMILPQMRNERGTYEYLFPSDKKVAEIEKEEVNTMDRYDTADQVPNWAKPTIRKLVEKKLLLGDAKGSLDLSMDMIRIYVTLDRKKMFD